MSLPQNFRLKIIKLSTVDVHFWGSVFGTSETTRPSHPRDHPQICLVQFDGWKKKTDVKGLLSSYLQMSKNASWVLISTHICLSSCSFSSAIEPIWAKNSRMFLTQRPGIFNFIPKYPFPAQPQALLALLLQCSWVRFCLRLPIIFSTKLRFITKKNCALTNTEDTLGYNFSSLTRKNARSPPPVPFLPCRSPSLKLTSPFKFLFLSSASLFYLRFE